MFAIINEAITFWKKKWKFHKISEEDNLKSRKILQRAKLCLKFYQVDAVERL